MSIVKDEHVCVRVFFLWEKPYNILINSVVHSTRPVFDELRLSSVTV